MARCELWRLAGALGGAVAAGALALLAGCGSSTSSTPDAAGAGGGEAGPWTEPVLDGGGGVPNPPNGADLCPPGVCNYQTGTGCGPDGGAGACVPMEGTAGGLAPACIQPGPVQRGAPCSAYADCAAGLVCAGGACHKLCCGRDWTGCPAGQSCFGTFVVTLRDGSLASSGADLCLPLSACDPLNPSSCQAAGQQCVIVDPTGSTACMSPGAGTAGRPCPCQGGYLCVASACRRLCKAVPGGGEPSCPTGEGRCVHFDRDPSGVGECTLP